MKNYLDATLSPRERAGLLLREMTLDEKMAQIVGVFAIKGHEDKLASFFRHGIEKGAFEVQIGASSEDIRLKDAFTVTESAWLEGKDRTFYALGEIQ